MQDFYTAVVELQQPFQSEFATEPYETGWAYEANFFVSSHGDVSDFDRLKIGVQVSSDGISWVEEGTTIQIPGSQLPVRIPVSNFGGWLRLHGDVIGGEESATLTIHLALKG